MSLGQLSDEQLAEFVENPFEFLKKKEHYEMVFDLNVDQVDRRVSQVQTSLGLPQNSLRRRIEQAK